MLLQKTEKAYTELRPGVRTLGLRERTLLLLCDGNKSLMDVRPMFDGEGEQIVLSLMSSGYLVPIGSNFERAGPPPAAQAASTPPAAEVFEGRRSLATTRMFLFDICERMFARRNPAQAEQFREALRNAKDRESMLAAGRDMIAEIERIAGHDRADSISERIATLLPPETGT